VTPAIQIPECFKTVVVVDFEFIPRVKVVCVAWEELRSGRTGRLWYDQFGGEPPYPIGPDSLFIAYNAQADLGAHLMLSWELPCRVLDPYFEFRLRTSGIWPPKHHRRLLEAVTFYGLPSIDAVEKEEMRKLVLRGPPWSVQERNAILEYCASDVKAEKQLFFAMAPDIDWPRALFRGRYAAALVHTDEVGMPLDKDLVERLDRHQDALIDGMIAEVDQGYGIFEGRTFKYEGFDRWRIKEGIDEWPLTESGRLDLRDETLKDMSETYPQVKPIRHVRQSLAAMRLYPHGVSEDGRSRPFQNPSGTSTGRNAPRTNESILNMSKWRRGLVKPREGDGLGILDFSSEEIGCAAGLSDDRNMKTSYRSGDAYFWFALEAGLIPPDMTLEAFQPLRPLYKMAFLAINYGIGPESLGLRINRPTIFAQHLIERHHDLFPDYWKWSDRAVDHAMLFGWQMSVFGWIHRLSTDPRPTALRNFPIQSAGAEILRLAHCLLTENGIRVCAPNHDSFVIESRLETLDQDIARALELMAKASRVVLRGFELFVDAKTVRYPDRYSSSEGKPMWDLVMRLLAKIESEASIDRPTTPVLV
jgi:hypothetical protein